MITVISLSRNIENLPSLTSNWNEVSGEAKSFMMNGSDFRIMNSQEMLVYNGRQIIASCSIDILENDTLYIENCYTKEGRLF
jgi:hypothetical protein